MAFMVSLAGDKAYALVTIQVTASEGLETAASKLRVISDSGVQHVQFSSFSKLGQFRLESPPNRIDSLIFERNPELESDSAIRVDSTLFDIRKMRGTVVLRGLAFQLAYNATLVSGGDPIRENGSLIIDSCMIFGEDLSAPFLFWYGQSGSNVEIRRSFFVFRNATFSTQPRMVVTGGEVTMANNLFNFAGLMSVTANTKFNLLSNTINRAQFDLVGRGTPSFYMNLNYVAYPPSQDVFSTTGPFLLRVTGFVKDESNVLMTRIQQGWKGFDAPSDAFFSKAAGSNLLVPPDPGRPSTELWKWYLDGDKTFGFGNGSGARQERYNVWPDETFHTFLLDSGPAATVAFKNAPFPRQFTPIRNSSLPPPPSSFLPPEIRVQNPGRGAIHFGNFQIESMLVDIPPELGIPVMLSRDTQPVFQLQAPMATQPGGKSNFGNALSSARNFYLGFTGNTKRGTDIRPTLLTGGFGKDDSLVFSQVDSAGFTQLEATTNPSLPDSLRSLRANMQYRTSASVSGTILYGLPLDSIKPYSTDKVRWWNAQSGSLQPARKAGEKWVGESPAAPAFSAYLVELLNIKRGKETLIGRGGDTIRATSAEGYQLTILDSAAVDTTRFGSASRAYQFSWMGRGKNDSIFLRIKGNSSHSAYAQSPGEAAVELKVRPDSSGHFEFQIASADSNRWFFLGIRFNAFPADTLESEFDSVQVSGMKIVKPGLLGFATYDEAAHPSEMKTLEQAAPTHRFLGGRSIKAETLELEGDFQVGFKIKKPGPLGRVEAYGLDSSSWTQIPGATLDASDSTFISIPGIDINLRSVVVVQRLLPSEDYVSTTLDPKAGKLVFTSRYITTENKEIRSYSVILRYVSSSGEVRTDPQDAKLIGDSLTLDITDKNGLFSYGIQYLTAEGSKYGGTPTFKNVDKVEWDARRLSNPDAVKKEDQWTLVGFPFSGKLLDVMVYDTNSRPRDSVMEIRSAYRLVSNSSDNPTYDSVLNLDKVKVEPGQGYLMGATRPLRYTLDASLEFLPGVPNILEGTGWKFISCPFPMAFQTDKVKSSTTSQSPFLQLTRPGGGIQPYSWVVVTQLKPFTGYAYYFQSKETLTFDPWVGNSITLSKKKISAENQGESLEVRFSGNGETRAMKFMTGLGARSVPYLPIPGKGFEARIGGDHGYYWKKVNTLERIDEPVVIESPSAMKAALTIASGSFSSERNGLPPGFRVRLLDLESGHAYQEAELDQLEFPAGKSSFRLIMGNADFVGSELAAFNLGVPREVELSQNFPNPFQNQTRVSLAWPTMPSGQAGLRRLAKLEVFDAAGKRMKSLDLGEVRVGRQVVTLDGSAWHPGVHMYRLTVITGSKRRILQKRMLVLP